MNALEVPQLPEGVIPHITKLDEISIQQLFQTLSVTDQQIWEELCKEYFGGELQFEDLIFKAVQLWLRTHDVNLKKKIVEFMQEKGEDYIGSDARKQLSLLTGDYLQKTLYGKNVLPFCSLEELQKPLKYFLDCYFFRYINPATLEIGRIDEFVVTKLKIIYQEINEFNAQDLQNAYKDALIQGLMKIGEILKTIKQEVKDMYDL